MFDLSGKVTFVTGASQGIGEVIAKYLARMGSTVVCGSIPVTEQDLQRVVADIQAEGGKADHVLVDVSSGESVKAAVNAVVERHGGLHVLVNNAGITKDKLLIQLKEEEWDAVLGINLKGAFLVTQAAARPMMKQRWGRIINIASVVGQMGNAGQANYVSSKAGLIGLTKTTAREFAARNITANAVAPGYIATAMTEVLSDEVKAEFTRQIPLGRMGQPADIAAAVAFLASEEASYITGCTIPVNGGMLMP